MKTFAEAFTARGLDDWDIAQSIKKLQASLKRNLTRQDPFCGPNAADMAEWRRRNLTGPALTATYVATFERINNLQPQPPALVAVSPAPTLEAAPQVAAPASDVDLQRPTRRPRTAPKPCRRNPLDTLLGAVHDAHLAAREGARRARHHIATA